MSKDKISDYSATANSNTDIGGINIDEGCAPSGINDAIRTLMKQLKDWQSGSQDVYIHPAGSASVPSITATGDTNTGIFFPAADTVGITTGGTERARVDSSGNLGLGVTPSAWGSSKAVQVNGGTSLWNYATTNSYFGNNYYYNGSNRVYYASSAAGEYSIQGSTHLWYGAASGTAGATFSLTQLMSVDKGKTLALEGTTSVTGTGITFPATQSASSDANTLDDYEEGNWTPALEFGGASTGVSYSVRTARYVKIGRQVFLQAYINLNSKGSATGNARITGIPFTPENTAGVYTSVSTFWLDVVPTSGQMVNQMEPGTAAVVLYYYDGGAVSRYRAVTEASINNNSTLYVCINYNV